MLESPTPHSLTFTYAAMPVYRAPADPPITTCCGTTIVSRRTSSSSWHTSCVTRTYAVRVACPSLLLRTTLTWWRLERGITLWRKSMTAEKGAVTQMRWRGHPRQWLEPSPSTPTPSKLCTSLRPRNNYLILGNDLTHQILATCQKPAHPNFTKCSHGTV